VNAEVHDAVALNVHDHDDDDVNLYVNVTTQERSPRKVSTRTVRISGQALL
jgi:hypothetical protein